MQTVGIILAAGRSKRFGNRDKLIEDLAGRPLLAYSIEKFDQSLRFCHIILVARKGKENSYKNILDKYCTKTPYSIVTGGNTRQKSVYKGITSINWKPDLAVIHDGARPFITQACIVIVIESALKYGAASLGIRPKELIKIDNGRGYVEATIEKRFAWQVQTPQAFRWQPLIEAHKLAANKINTYEDDASLLEKSGHLVRMVEGEENNIKITTPYDMLFAEFILSRQHILE